VNAPLEIRQARAEDAPLLLEMIRELAAYEKLENGVSATEEQLRDTLFAQKYAEAILAFEQGQAAGFAVCFHGYSTFIAKPTLYIEDLFVRPAFRAKGIGQHLFATLLEMALARGCGRVEWVVLDWNAPALAFYRRFGAQERREWVRVRLADDEIANAFRRFQSVKALANQGAA
jgi:GNAT superfamily N-acetyltransferase